MIIERSIEIARAPLDVFAFVSDPGNDPSWCPKVESVELVGGPAGGPGARYVVVHRPIPFRPPRRMDYRVVEWAKPERIVWREDDGHDAITVTYLLEESELGTSFTQRDEARLGAAKVLHPLMRVGIGMDVARQLKLLRRVLEER